MDEIWERAVETALDGQTDHAVVRNLTLDGAVKCVHGRLPHPSVFERFPNLQHLSLANIGASSLEQFPRLVNLQKLVLSDNRIAGGLECLVEAGLRSLVDLDLSNNRIQYIEDLLPLAELRLVSLDLYECPVTRVKDYRARVFGLIKSLKYLDKMDAEENETPESDEEDDEEEEEDEEEDDPGSGEVDGGDRPLRTENGHGSVAADGILDGDDDEESDADEEENEIVANGQYVHHESNGFRMVRAEELGNEENDEEIEEEDNSSGEEINEEDAEDDEVVEVHEIADSDDEDDGVEYEDDEEDDGEEEDEDEEVDNEEQGVRLASNTVRFASTEGEIDGHEQGEDDADEDDNGETGEEDEQGLEEEGGYEEEDAEDEDEDDDEENGSGYLVQPVNQHAIANDEDDDLSDMEPVNDVGDDEEDDEDIYDEEDVDDDLDNGHQVHQVELPTSSSSLHSKRKRSDEEEEDDDDDEDDEDSGEEDDTVQQAKLPKNDP